MDSQERNYCSSSIVSYMKTINKIDCLTIEEEQKLGNMLFDDNKREYARNRLIECNLRLVVKIAVDYKGFGVPMEDLVAEGNLGLLVAIEKYNVNKGKFSTYSAWWIKTYIAKAINKGKMIRIPFQSDMKRRKVYAIIKDFENKNGYTPSVSEIHKILGGSEKTVQNLIYVNTSDMVSLNAKFDETRADSDELIELFNDNDSIDPLKNITKKDDTKMLAVLVSKLDKREQSIIKLRYGLTGQKPKTLDEVSAIIGKTKERIRQIERDAIVKLKNKLPSFT